MFFNRQIGGIFIYKSIGVLYFIIIINIIIIIDIIIDIITFISKNSFQTTFNE